MSGIEEAKNGAQAGWEEAFRYFIIFRTAEGRSPRTFSDTFPSTPEFAPAKLSRSRPTT